MLDQDTLKPVIISMIVYMIVAKMIPEFIKKPTGVAFIDDINMMLIAQKGSLTSGAILTDSLFSSLVTLKANSSAIFSLPTSLRVNPCSITRMSLSYACLMNSKS